VVDEVALICTHAAGTGLDLDGDESPEGHPDVLGRHHDRLQADQVRRAAAQAGVQRPGVAHDDVAGLQAHGGGRRDAVRLARPRLPGVVAPHHEPRLIGERESDRVLNLPLAHDALLRGQKPTRSLNRTSAHPGLYPRSRAVRSRRASSSSRSRRVEATAVTATNESAFNYPTLTLAANPFASTDVIIVGGFKSPWSYLNGTYTPNMYTIAGNVLTLQKAVAGTFIAAPFAGVRVRKRVITFDRLTTLQIVRVGGRRTGRAFFVNKDGVMDKTHSAINKSFIRILNDSVSTLNSTFPDNENFTIQDCELWEYRYGLVTNPGLSLQDRRSAILRKMGRGLNVPARQHKNYIEYQLRTAGFDVYVQAYK